MRYKGIIFDFDGTLLDSIHEGLNRFVLIAQSFGLVVDEMMLAKVRSVWGASGYTMVPACWPDVNLNEFLDAWEEFDTLHPIAAFPGARETIDALSQEFHLSICTARGRSTHAQLRFHAIDQYFGFVCTRHDSERAKPHPESIVPLLHHYARHEIFPQDLVIVGDSVHSDYALARGVGIDFIAVTSGNNSRNDFLDAGVDMDHIIDSVCDLSDILK